MHLWHKAQITTHSPHHTCVSNRDIGTTTAHTRCRPGHINPCCTSYHGMHGCCFCKSRLRSSQLALTTGPHLDTTARHTGNSTQNGCHNSPLPNAWSTGSYARTRHTTDRPICLQGLKEIRTTSGFARVVPWSRTHTVNRQAP